MHMASAVWGVLVGGAVLLHVSRLQRDAQLLQTVKNAIGLDICLIGVSVIEIGQLETFLPVAVTGFSK